MTELPPKNEVEEVMDEVYHRKPTQQHTHTHTHDTPPDEILEAVTVKEWNEKSPTERERICQWVWLTVAQDIHSIKVALQQIAELKEFP